MGDDLDAFLYRFNSKHDVGDVTFLDEIIQRQEFEEAQEQEQEQQKQEVHSQPLPESEQHTEQSDSAPHIEISHHDEHQQDMGNLLEKLLFATGQASMHQPQTHYEIPFTLPKPGEQQSAGENLEIDEFAHLSKYYLDSELFFGMAKNITDMNTFHEFVSQLNSNTDLLSVDELFKMEATQNPDVFDDDMFRCLYISKKVMNYVDEIIDGLGIQRNKQSFDINDRVAVALRENPDYLKLKVLIYMLKSSSDYLFVNYIKFAQSIFNNMFEETLDRLESLPAIIPGTNIDVMKPGPNVPGFSHKGVSDARMLDMYGNLYFFSEGTRVRSVLTSILKSNDYQDFLEYYPVKTEEKNIKLGLHPPSKKKGGGGKKKPQKVDKTSDESESPIGMGGDGKKQKRGKQKQEQEQQYQQFQQQPQFQQQQPQFQQQQPQFQQYQEYQQQSQQQLESDEQAEQEFNQFLENAIFDESSNPISANPIFNNELTVGVKRYVGRDGIKIRVFEDEVVVYFEEIQEAKLSIIVL